MDLECEQEAFFIKPRVAKQYGITEEVWLGLFNTEGQIVNPDHFYRLVFEAGIDPSIRKSVWKFLYGVYPLQSTYRERLVIDAENRFYYDSIKAHWQRICILVGSSKHRYFRMTPEYMEDDNIPLHLRPDRTPNISPPSLPHQLKSALLRASSVGNDVSLLHLTLTPKYAEMGAEAESIPVLEGLCPVTELENSLSLQASIFASKINLVEAEYAKVMRSIDKDVPRTDRDLDFFTGKKNENLIKVRNILASYASVDRELGYVQGMNDVLSRFLVVAEDETEAFWLFFSFMKKGRNDFLEQSFYDKVELVKELLAELDTELDTYFKESDMHDFMFVQRWLIMCFKREFSFEDGLYLFDVIACHFLELNTDEGRRYQRHAQRTEFKTEGCGLNSINSFHCEFNYLLTFEMFVCCAVLITYKAQILKLEDIAQFFTFISSISGKMNVCEVINKAQHLLYIYCKWRVRNSFQEITSDWPSQNDNIDL
ncbi:TBC1 domain family member 15-like [Oopsacas minuta]|uniref:TBC1 domain family member 15-like n=1 Tax=Oopsacas minuta TaxID=111878 RepID=A0AAV7JAT4_9METZ|nr:TBC1 domain family member 15-like [Oopsacas minuta]